jgi:hypothetical protein
MPWAFQRTKRLAFSKSLLDQILVMPGRPSTVDPRIEVRRRLEVFVPEQLPDRLETARLGIEQHPRAQVTELMGVRMTPARRLA